MDYLVNVFLSHGLLPVESGAEGERSEVLQSSRSAMNSLSQSTKVVLGMTVRTQYVYCSVEWLRCWRYKCMFINRFHLAFRLCYAEH
jgi:hypothetical protein